MEENNKFLAEHYDSLASNYNQRWKKYITKQYDVIKPFAERVYNEFGEYSKIADLGSGVGLNSHILTEMFSFNFNVTALDFSKEMVEYTRKNSPKAITYNKDFLDWDTEEKFHGIVAGSFLNQFDYSLLPYVVEKMYSLMHEEGYALVYTSDTKDYEDCEEVSMKKNTRPYLKMIDRLNLSNLLSQFFDIKDYYKGYGKRDWTITVVKKP